jgi:hypothetical protein
MASCRNLMFWTLNVAMRMAACFHSGRGFVGVCDAEARRARHPELREIKAAVPAYV